MKWDEVTNPEQSLGELIFKEALEVLRYFNRYNLPYGESKTVDIGVRLLGFKILLTFIKEEH